MGGGFLIQGCWRGIYEHIRVQIMKDGGGYTPHHEIIHSNPFKWIQCSTRKLLAPEEVTVRAEKTGPNVIQSGSSVPCRKEISMSIT